MNTATDIRIASITLLWTEGSMCDVLDGTTVATVAEINSLLRGVHSDPPSGGGYNKTKISITLTDGSVFTRRHDVTRKDPCFLADELRSELRFFANDGREMAGRYPAMVEDAKKLLAAVDASEILPEPARSENPDCLEYFLGL